jgi:IS5 family transposase
VPVAFDLVPGGLHDLTPIHELTYGLPEGAAVYADKAYNAGDDEATILADTGVRLVPIRKANMRPNRWADKLALRACRKRIETLYSQLTAMGLQQLHARTNAGLELKVHAALLAAVVTNAN